MSDVKGHVHVGIDLARGDDVMSIAVLRALTTGFSLISLERFAGPRVPDWLRRELRLHRIGGAASRSSSVRCRKRALHQAGMRTSRKIRFRRWSPLALMPSLAAGNPTPFYQPAPGAPKFATAAEAEAWLEAQAPKSRRWPTL